MIPPAEGLSNLDRPADVHTFEEMHTPTWMHALLEDALVPAYIVGHKRVQQMLTLVMNVIIFINNIYI
jgi:hypothetical protein